jgi:hypothetical protein
VVQSPLVAIQAHPLRPGHFDNFGRQFRQSRGRVVEGKQFRREAIEVVDGARPRHGGHGSGADEPVGGDHQHGARTRQLPAKGLPGFREGVLLQGIHRASMADEQCRHPLGHAFTP